MDIRITNISKLTANGFAKMDKSYGLGIEKRCENDNYIVVAFVYPDRVECIDDRIFNCSQEEFIAIKHLIKAAQEILSLYEED